MKIKVLSKSLFAIVVLVAGQFSFGMEGEQKSVPLHIIPVGNGFSIQNIQLRDMTIDLLLLKENKPYLGQYNLESKIYIQNPIDKNDKPLPSLKPLDSFPKALGPYTLHHKNNTIELFKKATQEQSKKPILFAGGENQQYKKSIENTGKNRTMLQKSESIKNMFADLGGIDNVNSEIPLYNINSQVELDNLFKFMELTHGSSIGNIETELNTLPIDQLCSLAKHSNYYDINCYCNTLKKDIRLTEMVCKAISRKYIPITDQACIKQLKFDLENMIARERVRNVIKYIDDHIAPVISFDIGDVFLVASSPKSEIIIIGYYDSTTKIWNAKTGEFLHTLTGHVGWVNSVTVSSDGKIVVTGSDDKTAKIWDAQTGECFHTFTGHTDTIHPVAISSDGQIVVTGSHDNTAKIWNAKTGKCLHTLTGHAGWVVSVVISSDGKRIVTGSRDNTAKIWDAQTGICLHTLTGRTGWVLSVAISSDGEEIITGSEDKTAKIWEMKTKQCLRTLTGHTDWVTSVVISSDGKIIVTGSYDKTAKIWDAKTGECLHTLAGHTDEIISITISPDGKRVVTGSRDSTVKIWNIDDAAKKEFLNKLTIEQADMLTEEVYPVIKVGKKLEPLPKSKEYRILMTISPKAQVYLKDHIKIIAALPIQNPAPLPDKPPFAHDVTESIYDQFVVDEILKEYGLQL